MNTKFHTEAASTALMKYCQAIEVIDWLAARGDYCGGDKHANAAFWFATTNPSHITDQEAKFVADVVFHDDKIDHESALRYRRDELRNLRREG